jgi:hypothetical protein
MKTVTPKPAKEDQMSKDPIDQIKKGRDKTVIAKSGGFIKDAIKKGEKIPAGKLAAAAKKPGKMGQRARLAQTLKKLGK